MTRACWIAYAATAITIPFLTGAVAGATPRQVLADLFGLLARAAELGLSWTT